MGRPRAFDESEAVQAAAALFAQRAFDGVSVDDLVAHLGVHRNSLYAVFGSKRGLYLRALRWSLQHQVRPLLSGDLATLATEPALDLLLLAAAERAPQDPEVAQEVGAVLAELDAAAGGAATVSAALLGLRLRARVTGEPADTTILATLFT